MGGKLWRRGRQPGAQRGQRAELPEKRHAARTARKTGWKTARTARKTARKPKLLKANLGQMEAKQEALSEEQFRHMKGGKVADSLERQKQKEQAKP
jgi:hypothetical protein